jgi:hypothetical protein
MTMLDQYTPVFYCNTCKEPVLGEYADDEGLITSCEFCGTVVAEIGDWADLFALKNR